MKLDWPVDNKENICIANYEILSVLGAGGFGTCYKAKSMENQAIVAVKKLNRTGTKKQAMLQSYECETRAEIFQFEHKNIVKLLHATNSSQPVEDLYIVMEFVEGCSMQSLLDNHDAIIDFQLTIKLCSQIAIALDYIHKHGIAHLDLKPANIIVTPDYICKLADFGCSESIENYNADKTSHLTGTFAFRAPELLRGGIPTGKGDIYSLGITMWQIWSRKFPYGGLNQHAVIFRVVSAKLRPSFDPNLEINPHYKDLMIKCWAAKPEDRPSASEVNEQLNGIIIMN